MKFFKFNSLFLLSIALQSYSQTKCKADMIVGEWRVFHHTFESDTNFEHEHLTKLKLDTTDVITWTWIFGADGFRYTLPKKKSQDSV